ncbi:hypothetical protein AXG93_1971s1080 [Marchantia polymorpha subsp. ruderalis]|uniref:Uncharacterized protein n=1 Tax=Marchantia polymorpha subsp. ruderalis TaxID=1480154 RepID=A0A176WHT9_MARPO|nr:hypothetical protein AXG93_1971s1080 [Marchantia polymorpha subsp. ruderalis]
MVGGMLAARQRCRQFGRAVSEWPAAVAAGERTEDGQLAVSERKCEDPQVGSVRWVANGKAERLPGLAKAVACCNGLQLKRWRRTRGPDKREQRQRKDDGRDNLATAASTSQGGQRNVWQKGSSGQGRRAGGREGGRKGGRKEGG